MKSLTRFTLLLTTVALLLTLTLGVAVAAPSADTIVVTNQRHEGDLDLTEPLEMEENSVVTGDVNMFGNSATIAGTIEGDLFILGGTVILEPTAVIEGDCVLLVGSIVENHTATSCMEIGEMDSAAGSFEGAFPFVEFNIAGDNEGYKEYDGYDGYEEHNRHGAGMTFGGVIASSILAGLLAMCIMAIAPRHITRISESIQYKPVTAGVFGVLTFIAAISLIVLVSVISGILIFVCIGLLGIPIVLLMMALLFCANVAGYVAIGKIIGEAIAEALHLNQLSLAVTAGLGAALLALSLGLLSMIPAIGFSASIVSSLVGAVGLGATALTRFGTRPWPLFVIDPDKEEDVLNTLDDQIIL